MNDKCPKCGSNPCTKKFDNLHVGEWFCGSHYADDGEIVHTDECRIRELEATVASRDKTIAELESAIEDLERRLALA